MSIRRYIEIIETSDLNEITMLSHNDADEASLAATMMTFYRHRLRPGREIKQIGALNDLTIWGDSVPPNIQFRPFFFFKDHTGKVVGWCVLEMSSRNHIEKAFRVKMIYFLPEARGIGNSLAFYQYVINSGVPLESDARQSLMSAAVWAKLAKMTDYKVEVIDQGGEIVSDDPNDAYGSSNYLLGRLRN